MNWETVRENDVIRIGDLERNTDIPRLINCPDCTGRGWFLIQPFLTGGPGGAGGPYNMRVCNMCIRAHVHFQATGELPADIAEKIRKKESIASLEAQRRWWKPKKYKPKGVR